MSYRTFAAAALLAVAIPASIHAQAPGRPSAQAQSPKDAAPIDLTGYWVSIVTEDWRFRMVTPPKGDYPDIPLNAEGRKAADAWDPAKDEGSANACKAYGAANIMRMPGRLRITWENDTTLKIEADSGTQTRLLHFNPPQTASREPQWQGQSVAQWEGRLGGRGAAAQPRSGSLKVSTTHMRPGYLQKNGVPYGGDAVMTEYFDIVKEPDGDQWLVVKSIVEDPQYLIRSLIRSTHFKKLANASGWNPTPCAAR